MDLKQLEQKLIRAARQHAPPDDVPAGFERRVAAHLRSRVVPDLFSLWSQALWRAAAPCTAIMLCLGAWSWYSQANATPATDWSQDFDTLVLAGIDLDSSNDLSR